MSDWREQLFEVFDRELEEELAEMTCHLVNIMSPTGEERAIGDYVASRFRELGMDVRFQEVEPERYNVIAALPGSANGRRLLFNGHFDTSTIGDEPDLPFGLRPEATVADGWIYGLGVSNMKAAHASYYGAVKALLRAGVHLAGDLLVCGVVGEIEKAPVDQYVGRRYRGGGIGTIYAAHHGVLADGAIIGEPTGLRLQLGNTSYAFVRIGTRGVAQHTWSKERGEDAIERGVRLLQALKEWEPTFEALHPHPRMGSRLAVSAIQGGFPFKPSIAPAPSCVLYMDIRFPPDVTTVRVERELRDFLRGLTRENPDLESTVEFYLCRGGYEIDPDEPLAQAVGSAHREIVGEGPRMPEPYRFAVSADASILNEYGIPALTYGPGGIDRDGSYRMYDENGELCSIENIVACAKVYALAASAFCGVAE